jgi:hypothetical protein
MRNGVFRTAVSMLVVGLLHSCAHVVAYEPSTVTVAGVTARLQRNAVARHQAEGTIRAALPGLQGVAMQATVDVAAVAPQRLSVSVRSFFDLPMQVLVADGDTVTLYDATSGAGRFARGPATPATLQRVLGVPLMPDDVVALLLGRAPIDARADWPAPRVGVQNVDAVAGTYTAIIERAGRGALWWTARLVDDALVSAVAFAGDGRRLVEVTASDIRPENGVLLAHSLSLHLVPADEGGAFAEARDVVLTVQELRFNGEAIANEAFVLQPPAGTPIDAL